MIDRLLTLNSANILRQQIMLLLLRNAFLISRDPLGIKIYITHVDPLSCTRKLKKHAGLWAITN
jgi:hypothetical protein